MGTSGVGVRGVGIAKAGAATIAISISGGRIQKYDVAEAAASKTTGVEVTTKSYSLFNWLRNVKKLAKVDFRSFRSIMSLVVSIFVPNLTLFAFQNRTLLNHHR